MTTYDSRPVSGGLVASYSGDVQVRYREADIDRIRIEVGGWTLFLDREAARIVAWRLQECVEQLDEALQPIQF